MKYIDPMVIPKFECASFNNRGGRCQGTKELDKNKWCNRCLCYQNIWKNKMKNKMKKIAIFLIILCFSFSYSYSHEGYGWFHMKDSTGPCIGTERCGYNMIWMIDYNDDGIIDKCIANRLIHDKWHVKDYKVDKKNNKCTCEEVLKNPESI